MSDDELAAFVTHVHGSCGFAERVVFGHKIDRYGDQIRDYIDRRADHFTNVAEGRVWKRKTLEKMARFEGGVQGYAWDEKRGAAYATTQYRSGRLSMSPAFSGTIQAISRTKRILGYITVLLLIGFTLWLGWVVAQGLRTGLMTFENYAERLKEFYLK